MKSFLLFFLATSFFLTCSAIAQVNDGGGHSLMQINVKAGDDLSKVEGTSYLYDDYRPGMVSMEGKEPLRAFLRYDINSETFEIKTEITGEEIYALPLNILTKYHLGSEIFIYKSLNFNNKDIVGYFQIHFEGNRFSLIEKPSLEFTEGVQAKTGYCKDKPGQIKLVKNLYIVFNDGTVRHVNLKEKDFEKAFSSAPMVKKYLAENKLKTMEDYSKMLEWYDNQIE